ncbi:MAG TPA: RIO1 family regulatory kinase/ATPase [Candidatus Acidoferrales bacterium]|jgi:RIO kinase 2|nr:RIO1 family regulatory kinase/ATPase [Candidatus Acidoferrales bacterium]
MLQDIAREFRNLQRYDFRVLRGIETAMRFFDWTPLDELPNYARLPQEEVNYRIGRLSRHKLVQRKTAHYVGYKLTFAGYDALAIDALVRSNVIQLLGSKVGVGKESDIYDAKREDGEIVIVKFHREGTTFRHVKRSRGYFGQAERCSWMLASKLAAEREYEALMKLQERVTVPKPIAQNRHIVVMGFLEGRELSNTALEAPLAVLNEIMLQIKLAYQSGVVHADLSEYNVIVCAGGLVALIDWPQWITVSHPNADELLGRDLDNLLAYFVRKYQVTKRIEDCVAYIKQRQ